MKTKTVRMIHGDAGTPARFWGRALVPIEDVPRHLGLGWALTESSLRDSEFDDLKKYQIVPYTEVITELSRLVTSLRDSSHTFEVQRDFYNKELARLIGKLTKKQHKRLCPHLKVTK